MNMHIIFKLNKKLDKIIALDFIHASLQEGVNFANGIVNVHPKLKRVLKLSDTKKQKKVLDKYIDTFYKQYRIYLRKRTKDFSREWNNVEQSFFATVHTLFHGFPFPKGEYVGYVSIFNCNPRFLADKTFQVFYQHPAGVRYVTSHELLHFIFYNYTKKRFGRIFNGLNAEKGLWWDSAEIFNTVVLSSPEFVRIHGIKKIVSYPEHKKYIPRLRKLWQKNKNIDSLIKETVSLLRQK